MDIYNENYFEEILKSYGYYKDEKFKEKNLNCVNSDVENGFQDVNPLIFVTIGEVIANLISGSLPFNVANSVSNLIILIGQIIETYGTQQLYYENGPGRVYSMNNRKIDNKNCEENNLLEIEKEIDLLKKEFNKVINTLNKLENKVDNWDNNK